MKTNRLSQIITLFLIFIACTRAWAFFPGQEKILDSQLTDASAKGLVRIIVTLRGCEDIKGLDFRDDRMRLQSVQSEVTRLQDRVISEMGKHLSGDGVRLENLPIFSTSVFGKGLKSLAALDDVAFIEEDRLQELHTAQGIPLMNPGSFRSSDSGSGIAIAIVDTGINYKHPAMGGSGFPNAKVIGGYDFGDRDADPMDAQGHGTSCAGAAAGLSIRSRDYVGGVAPGAKICALKVMRSDGGIPTSAILGAWDWCVSHQQDDPSHPIMVISNSLGTPGYHNSDFCGRVSSSANAVAANAKANGIAIFVSSGNEGMRQGISFSACLQDTISVGAVYDKNIGAARYSSCRETRTARDQVTCYSNSARILDLLAPSNCAYVPGYPGRKYKKCFGGTSAACPYAAGAAALIQSHVRAKTGRFLSVDELRRVMSENGDPVRDAKSGITTPRVNIARSIRAAVPGGGGGDGGGSGSDPLDQLRDILRDSQRQ